MAFGMLLDGFWIAFGMLLDGFWKEISYDLGKHNKYLFEFKAKGVLL